MYGIIYIKNNEVLALSIFRKNEYEDHFYKLVELTINEKNYTYLSNSHSGDLLDVDSLKNLISQLKKSIDAIEYYNLKANIEEHNIRQEIDSMAFETNFKNFTPTSGFPIYFVNAGIKLMNSYNMRKTARPYICVYCNNSFGISEGDHRYYLNPYENFPTKFIEIDRHTFRGSCCSSTCLKNAALNVAIESIKPEYAKYFDASLIKIDIDNYIDNLEIK